MLAAKTLEKPVDDVLKEGNRVNGCQSQVWLLYDNSEAAPRLFVWSDAKIMRGVLALLKEKVENTNPAATVDFANYLHELGLMRFLSESRANGIHYVIEKLESERRIR